MVFATSQLPSDHFKCKDKVLENKIKDEFYDSSDRIVSKLKRNEVPIPKITREGKHNVKTLIEWSRRGYSCHRFLSKDTCENPV